MVNDLATPSGESTPTVAQARYGRGRVFDTGFAFEATDAVADATLLARDFTVMAWIDFKILAFSDTDVGTIVLRHDGATAVSFAVELERVNSTTLKVRAFWDGPGASSTVGVNFAIPASEFMVSVVRTWNSATDVDVTYYINGDLIGSENVAQGAITATPGGLLAIGANPIGGYADHLPTDSVIDSLQIENDPVSAEEIRQIYRRVAVHQPAGYKILRAFLPGGEAWSRDPDSSVQRWIASEGDALGLEVADVERFREDYLPDRAYGGALEDWERITGQVPKDVDSVEVRRARVLGFLRTVLGFNPADLKTALEPLFGLAAVDIDIIEFDGLREDDFSVEDVIADPSRMWVTRLGAGAIVVDTPTPECDVSYGASPADARWWQKYPEPKGCPVRETSLTPMAGGDADGAMIIGTINAATAATDRFSGFFMRPALGVDVILWGVRGATLDLVHWTVDSGAVNTPTVISAGVSVPITLAMRYVAAGSYELGRIVAGAFVVDTTVAGPSAPRWAGFGCIEITNQATAGSASVRDLRVFEPNTPRAFTYLAVRNPALPGAYDLDSAQAQLDAQSPAHTRPIVVTDDQGFELGTGKLGLTPLYPKL